jgi:pyruvate dehydrogenase E2 component (dihydrolipoamide acetyltransferase)
MPRLSDSMEEGTILRWLVEDGATVARGDEIAEIETDKANMTYEADADGVFQRVAAEGDTLPIGAPIARIGDGDSSEGQATRRAGPDDSGRAHPGSSPGARASSSPPARSAEAADAESANADASAESGSPAPSPSMPAVGERSEAPVTPGDNGRVKASPVARRLARERGVDLGGDRDRPGWADRKGGRGGCGLGARCARCRAGFPGGCSPPRPRRPR